MPRELWKPEPGFCGHDSASRGNDITPEVLQLLESVSKQRERENSRASESHPWWKIKSLLAFEPEEKWGFWHHREN